MSNDQKYLIKRINHDGEFECGGNSERSALKTAKELVAQNWPSGAIIYKAIKIVAQADPPIFTISVTPNINFEKDI